MLKGQQVTPHKYIRRIMKGGKWHYVYADDPKKPIDPAKEQLKELKVVIAHQHPTPILVGNDSMIVFGPPQTMGKRLFVNTNPKKSYYGIAKNDDGGGAVYLYPESVLDDIKTKKAAKFLNASRSLRLIDGTAEEFMKSPYPIDQQYGLVMWLNNNTKLRIGAHEDAGSVDPVERRKIINQARAENWTDAAKEAALANARKPTFGLLTTRAGHIKMNPQTRTAQWSFRGKGGKMITGDNVTVKLPELQYFTLTKMLHMKDPEDKVFPDVVYKRIWAHYKTYGITPHATRGAFADQKVNELIDSFKRTKGESAQVAFTRFKKEVKEKISDKLGHTVDMTLRAYISDTTQRGVNEAFERTMVLNRESASMVPDGPEALAETIVWLAVGPGNIVV